MHKDRLTGRQRKMGAKKRGSSGQEHPPHTHIHRDEWNGVGGGMVSDTDRWKQGSVRKEKDRQRLGRGDGRKPGPDKEKSQRNRGVEEETPPTDKG